LRDAPVLRCSQVPLMSSSRVCSRSTVSKSGVKGDRNREAVRIRTDTSSARVPYGDGGSRCRCEPDRVGRDLVGLAGSRCVAGPEFGFLG
jgi:hypothetical protein